MTDQSGSGAGKNVASEPVQLKLKLDPSGAVEISYEQYSKWFDEAKIERGLQNVKNSELTKAQLSEVDAIRNQKMVKYMDDVGGDIFKIHRKPGAKGQKFYALNDKVMNKITSFEVIKGNKQLANFLKLSNVKYFVKTILADAALFEIGVAFVGYTDYITSQKYKEWYDKNVKPEHMQFMWSLPKPSFTIPEEKKSLWRKIREANWAY